MKGEIKTLIQFPFDKVVEQAGAVYDTACLDILVKTGVYDRLAQPTVLATGLSVQDMQRELNLDTTKLTVVLRHLSSQGWLMEEEGGVFKLARASLELMRNSSGRAWMLCVIFSSLCDYRMTMYLIQESRSPHFCSGANLAAHAF